MYTRLKIVAANWKMHKNLGEGLELATQVIEMLHDSNPMEPILQVVLLPSFIHLSAVHKLLSSTGYIHVGAQNCHEQGLGAFTGEVSASMLRSVGAKFVLIGHNERRTNFHEDSALLAQKVNAALLHGLQPIFCCGESSKARKEGDHNFFVHEQLVTGLFHLSATQMAKSIIAYEPVWAIGTGESSTSTPVSYTHLTLPTKA